MSVPTVSRLLVGRCVDSSFSADTAAKAKEQIIDKHAEHFDPHNVMESFGKLRREANVLIYAHEIVKFTQCTRGYRAKEQLMEELAHYPFWDGSNSYQRADVV